MASWPEHSQLKWQRSKPSYVYQSKERAWVGWDTETVEGDIGLISRDAQPLSEMDEETRGVITKRFGGELSDWKKWKPRKVVNSDTILQQMFHPGYHGVWWNLRYDIECILKQLPENLIRALLLGQTIQYKGYKLDYIPGKKFTITKGNHKAHHFDFADFYHTSLENAAKTFLDDEKKKESFTRRELGESWDIWQDKKEEIIEYCKHDAYLTRKLAQLWAEWAKEFGIDASYPISPANVAGRHALRQGFPDYSETQHKTVGKAAWQAYYGGRFEARKKGWFDELWGIDLKSAYPAEIVDLPPADCSWQRTHDESKALEYPWGFVRCKIRVDYDADWSPVMHRKEDGLVFGPVGPLGKKWITLDEYEICKKHEKTSVDFIKAWVGTDNGERPLEWVGDLYEERAKLKENNDPREIVIKLAMNSVYGKTLQRNPINDATKLEDWNGEMKAGSKVILVNGEPYEIRKDEYKIGPVFNPMYAATITARTRCRLWEMMQKYETAIVMTDGILIEEKPDAQDLGSELGDWEIDAHGEGVIIGNGLYQVGDKRSKRRGFNVPERFKGWIHALEEADDKAERIVINQRRPLHPGEVLTRNDYDLTDVGAFVDMQKSVHFNHDRKREFPDVTAEGLLEDNYEGRCISLA